MSVEKAGKPAVPAVEAERVQFGRDEAAKAIRASLRRRSGRAWSVTVGRGTVWGWLTITAPPSRREEGGSTMRVEDRAELARLLGLGETVHAQGVMVCPEERSEYVDRARGDAPRRGRRRSMTRRERLECKAEKRRAWAEKAAARSDARFGTAHQIASGIPLGQPILVGHHSEKHARRDQERIESNMSKGCEEHRLAQHHEASAAGIEAQLDRSVFSDDADAIQQLGARIAKHEEEAARYAEINAIWRRCKGDVAAMVAAGVSQKIAETAASTMKVAPWIGKPLDTGHLRAAIRRDRERIEQIRKRTARAEGAAAKGGVLVEGDTYVRVTFAEKPEQEVLDALHAAGFRWGSGSWMGERAKLPACVAAPTEEAPQGDAAGGE